MHCPNCGNKIDDNDKFCRSCGKSLLSNENEIVIDNNTATQTDNSATQPPYCTNCGESVGSLKICPHCQMKTKKNYKKYCRCCGGMLDTKCFCANCRSYSKKSFVEVFINILSYFLIAFCYYVGLLWVVANQKPIHGGCIILLTLVVHVLLYKYNCKLLFNKTRKSKSVFICICILCYAFAVLFASNFIANRTSDSYNAIMYSENIVKQKLKNPESMIINNSTVEDTFLDVENNVNYFIINVDYSAQNGFGGYNREEETIYVRVYRDNGIVEKISVLEYAENEINCSKLIQ